jgi:hypothetical protein
VLFKLGWNFIPLNYLLLLHEQQDLFQILW